MIEINEKQLKLENDVWQLNNLVGHQQLKAKWSPICKVLTKSPCGNTG